VSQPQTVRDIGTGLPASIRLVARPIASLAASAVSIVHVKSTPPLYPHNSSHSNELLDRPCADKSIQTNPGIITPSGRRSATPAVIVIRSLFTTFVARASRTVIIVAAQSTSADPLRWPPRARKPQVKAGIIATHRDAGRGAVPTATYVSGLRCARYHPQTPDEMTTVRPVSIHFNFQPIRPRCHSRPAGGTPHDAVHGAAARRRGGIAAKSRSG
jgi:hypothetical protein